MAVLLVLPQPQAQQLLRAAEFLQQRGPDGHPRASPLARAQFSAAPALLARALPCSCGGLASCRLQLRRSCPEAPEKTAHSRLRQGHLHPSHRGARMRRFFRRLWAGAPQLQPAACEAAASCRAALAPAAPEPRKIGHAPTARVRPLGAHLGRVATKTPQL